MQRLVLGDVVGRLADEVGELLDHVAGGGHEARADPGRAGIAARAAVRVQVVAVVVAVRPGARARLPGAGGGLRRAARGGSRLGRRGAGGAALRDAGGRVAPDGHGRVAEGLDASPPGRARRGAARPSAARPPAR